MSIQGTARLIEEYDDIRALGAKVAQRMAGGADLGELGDEIVEKQARKRVGIVVEPRRSPAGTTARWRALPGESGEPGRASRNDQNEEAS